MAENSGKVVFIFSEEVRTEEGDTGETTTTYTQEQGKWTDCAGEKEAFISPDSSKLEFRSISCICGQHMVSWAVIPKGVLPGKTMKILLITKKQ